MELFTVLPVGGAGSRLSPVTVFGPPKPLLRMPDPCGDPLIVQALKRMNGIVPPGNRTMVLSAQMHDAFKESGLIPADVQSTVEPGARGTGPALLIGARWVAERNPDGIIVNAPADHFIDDVQAFQEAVAIAAELAVRGYLVLFGVPPQQPDPGYGYILPGTDLHGFGHRVRGFREKPDADEANALIADGALINSGIFVWKAETFIRANEDLRPDWAAGVTSPNPDPQSFLSLESGSVDDEILEKAVDRLAVVPMPCIWDDVGTWPRLHERMIEMKLLTTDSGLGWQNQVPAGDSAPGAGQFRIRLDGREWSGSLEQLSRLHTDYDHFELV